MPGGTCARWTEVEKPTWVVHPRGRGQVGLIAAATEAAAVLRATGPATDVPAGVAVDVRAGVADTGDDCVTLIAAAANTVTPSRFRTRRLLPIEAVCDAPSVGTMRTCPVLPPERGSVTTRLGPRRTTLTTTAVTTHPYRAGRQFDFEWSGFSSCLQPRNSGASRVCVRRQGLEPRTR